MNVLVIAITFFGGLVVLVALLNGFDARRQARRMRETRPVSCSEALRSSGTVRVQGLAEPPPYPVGPPVGPLSGRPYAWCEARVSYDEWYEDAEGDRHSRTITVAHLPGAAFAVRDATGVVLVRSGDVEWHDLPASVNTTSRRLPEGLRQSHIHQGSELLDKVGLNEKWADRGARLLFSGDGRTYDLMERIVAPGTPVLVLGQLEPGPDGVPVLGGRVLASTESAQEVTTDQERGARRSFVVAGGVLAGILIAQLALHLT